MKGRRIEFDPRTHLLMVFVTGVACFWAERNMLLWIINDAQGTGNTKKRTGPSCISVHIGIHIASRDFADREEHA